MAIAKVARAGSPGVPLLVFARNDSGPITPVALPEVSNIPLSIIIGVDVETKVPLATPVQVSTGDNIVIPCPASFVAKTVAVWLGLTDSWQ